ncbi:hypothetical protein F511_02580 [Dorcoceras hygrometricum]|nr:hypothetical protein F511_02580 [Dorcoceras hygrometricum]
MMRSGNIPRTRMMTRFKAAVLGMKSNIFHFIYTRFLTSFDQSVAFMIPVLITLLHLKYKANDLATPFETHPSTMKLSVVATLLYYFTYGLRIKRYFVRHLPCRVVNHCLVCFGNTSVASLGSLFFDDSARPFLYVLCALFSASEGLYGFYQKFAQRIEEALHARRRPSYTCQFLVNLRRLVAPRPQILPLYRRILHGH